MYAIILITVNITINLDIICISSYTFSS